MKSETTVLAAEAKSQADIPKPNEDDNKPHNPNSRDTSPSPPSPPPPPANPHSKPCDLCQRRRDVLIRCQIDEGKQWKLICTGKCWNAVSGGQVDGGAEFPHYRYGGMWKNKHEYASAKIKGAAKERNKMRKGEREGAATDTEGHPK